MPEALFLSQLSATLFMTGLIWFVQIVHYPLFDDVLSHATPTRFGSYAIRHGNRTSYVVFPPMFVELVTAFAALFPSLRPTFVTQTQAIASAALVLLLWLSTGLLQVPLHTALAKSPTPRLIQRLVLSNWLRTLTWTARAALLLYSLHKVL